MLRKRKLSFCTNKACRFCSKGTHERCERDKKGISLHQIVMSSLPNGQNQSLSGGTFSTSSFNVSHSDLRLFMEVLAWSQYIARLFTFESIGHLFLKSLVLQFRRLEFKNYSHYNKTESTSILRLVLFPVIT